MQFLSSKLLITSTLCCHTLPEKFVFGGGVAGIELSLNIDSTFILRARNCEGVVDLVETLNTMETPFYSAKAIWRGYISPKA